jgi:hypothetical protein
MAQKIKRKNCKEYYIALGYNESDAIAAAKSYARRNCSSCIEYWRDRHPDWTEEQAQHALSEKLSLINTHRPDLRGDKNPGSKSKTSAIERRQRSPKCIEFYQKHYPELSDVEHEELLAKHMAYSKSKITPDTCCTQPEYWEARGYTHEEAIAMIHDGRFAFSLEKCVTKYGEEEGRKFYEDRQKRWQQSLRNRFIKESCNGIHQSRFANVIINSLMCYWPDIEKEFNIDKYSFDLRYKNVLIEFNGDYWHMNPAKYKSSAINKTSKKSAKDIWERDAQKITTATTAGYNILVVWESEYKSDPIATIQKCKDYINGNIK